MYDVIVIGLGCAGYTAAIYAARYKLSVYLVGAEQGGLGNTAAEVGNWPGIIDITGPDLMESFRKHAVSYEQVTMAISRVETVEKTATGFRIRQGDGSLVEGRAVIMATGSSKRHLGIPGEAEFSGKGVTYCATCDAFFYRNKTVAVIGGGDSAVEGAAIAAQVAKTVYLIHRRDSFRAEPYWVDKVRARENVQMVLNTNVLQVLGDQRVTGVRLDVPHQGLTTLPVDGVFIEIGTDPASGLAVQAGAAVDDHGHVRVSPGMHTTLPGMFAAGDLTTASNRFAQFTTAAGEGAVAANGVFTYLQDGHWPTV